MHRDALDRLAPADLFLALRAKLGLVPWCWYDGPENFAGDARGLFRWNGKAWVPTLTYEVIAKSSR